MAHAYTVEFSSVIMVGKGGEGGFQRTIHVCPKKATIREPHASNTVALAHETVRQAIRRTVAKGTKLVAVAYLAGTCSVWRDIHEI